MGRTIPLGTILDPATTRPVTAGVADPTSGIVAAKTGYVRDPFGTCAASTAAFTLAGCGLNQLDPSRLDPKAIALLNLYPLPTGSSLFTNYANSPKLSERRNSFDTRVDFNLSEKNQLFARFSFVDDPQFIPGIFGGVADGGGFAAGQPDSARAAERLGVDACVLAQHGERGPRRPQLPAHHPRFTLRQ